DRDRTFRVPLGRHKSSDHECASEYVLVSISLLIAVLLNAYLINAAVYSPFSMESEPAEYEYPEPAAYWNWRRPVHARVGPSATTEGRVDKKSFLLDSRLG
ncbi:hypothetical protein FGIG_09773, partial [Fasciola gigantica]